MPTPHRLHHLDSLFWSSDNFTITTKFITGSKATWWQAVSNTNFQYSITPGLYLGYWQMAFDRGWNRNGRDQAEWKSDASGFSISPQIAFSLDTSNLNFTVFTGYRAISLDYDYDSMDSSSATGVEFGASVGWKF